MPPVNCTAPFQPSKQPSGLPATCRGPHPRLKPCHPPVLPACCPQVKYVVELAKALALHPSVYRVDLLTRLIQ